MSIRSFYLSAMFVTCSALSANTANADSHTYYNPNWASGYATTNYNTAYGSGSGQNPFHDYGGDDEGGNCTNFASQVIMSGMVGSTSMSTVFGSRYDFDIDAGSSGYKWYWRSDGDRGPAFTGAAQLYQYAVNNGPSYMGLHFQYVTHDTTEDFMDYDLVQYGDIIFADWEHDGVIDHSMVVTDIQWWQLGYNEIRLTYQGAPGVVGKTNIGLGSLNEQFDYQAVFYVYRPVDYNPSGA